MNKSLKNLRMAMQGNSLFSALSGLSFISFALPISSWMNLGEPRIMIAIGIGLLVFSTLIIFLLPSERFNKRGICFIIIQDGIWVFGSMIILVFQLFSLSKGGYFAIAGIALIVALFGFLQNKYLKEASLL